MISIPNPCSESCAAMTPTAAGRHCAACQTEVVDFTRLSEAEVLAFMTTRTGQRVCALMATPMQPQHSKRARGPQRWLLAMTAFFGWQHPAWAMPPRTLPPIAAPTRQAADSSAITIRGVVLDDALKVPVEGIYMFLSGTKYGAITNDKGEFTLTFFAGWKPVSGGLVTLDIARVPFTFLGQTIQVDVKTEHSPAPLTIRLVSVPGRGNIKGKALITESPVPLPAIPKFRR